MTRLNLLSESAIEQQVAHIEQSFNDLKSLQPVAGDTVIYRQNFNPGWDIIDSGPHTDKYVRVVFTADNQEYAFADCFPYIEFTYSGTTYVWRPDINVEITGSTLVLFSINPQPILDPLLPANQSSIGFLFRITVDSSVIFRMKFYVVSNDTGTVEVAYV